MFTKLIEVFYKGLNDDIDRKTVSDSDDGTIDYEESSYIQSDPEQVCFLAVISTLSFSAKIYNLDLK